MFGPLLQALRPHQWVKNLLVFAPLVFAPQRITTPVEGRPAWLAAAIAFVVFCCVASSIYLINDVLDREHDRLHPKKRFRPIASGALPVPVAWAATVCLLAATVAGSLLLSSSDAGWLAVSSKHQGFALWPLAYLTLNLAYSFGLKRVVVLDCICVAMGFQIRVHAGASAIDVAASSWIILCTFFFSLFVAFCKRYEEVGRQKHVAGPTRATMKEYTVPFLNMIIGPLAALSILSYALYTVAPETVRVHGSDHLMFTVPVVVYGVFRYLFLVYRRDEGGDPARLLFRDVPLLISGVLYLAVAWVVLRH
jgi:4-hydroxybenzoate polyprenyltransferase